MAEAPNALIFGHEKAWIAEVGPLAPEPSGEQSDEASAFRLVSAAAFRMRRIFQDQARNEVAHRRENQEAQGEPPFVPDQKRHRAVSIPHGEIPDAEIPNDARQCNRRSKTAQRHFEHSRGEHEDLEWSRRRQQSGEQYSTETVFFDPVSNSPRSFPGFTMEECLSPLPRDEIQKNAPQHR